MYPEVRANVEEFAWPVREPHQAAWTRCSRRWSATRDREDGHAFGPKVVCELHPYGSNLMPGGTTKVQSRSVRSLKWDSVRAALDSEYERVWERAKNRAPSLLNDLAEAIDSAQQEPGDSYVQLRAVYNVT